MLKSSSFYILLVSAAAVHLAGFSLDVIEVDSAQLAEICREMLISANPFQLTYLNEPYLDKPHLVFWLGALSMKIFGVSSMSYKLPSLLFAALCAYSVFRFTRIFYGKEIAKTALLIAVSFQAMFIATNDVRADTILMGCVMFTIWQFAEWFVSGNRNNLLLSAAGLAFSMMAKGPIGFMVPFSAIFPLLIVSRTWKKLIDKNTFIACLVFIALMTPIVLAHYLQFGFDGLKFYFWSQSFGRITGESEWRNNPDPFFVLHTTLWAFLPFSLFLFYGIIKNGMAIFRPTQTAELFSFFGTTLTLLALSRSNYQLPHYFYVAYPLGSVLAANSFHHSIESKLNWWKWLHIPLLMAAALLPHIIIFYLFPTSWFYAMLFSALSLATAYFILKTRSWLSATVWLFLIANLCLNIVFYPSLLQFQSNTMIGKRLKKLNVKTEQLTVFNTWRTYALAFEARVIPRSTNNFEEIEERLSTRPHFVLCKSEHAEHFKNQYAAKVELETQDFPISTLTIDFLNPKKRSQTTEKVFLLRID